MNVKTAKFIISSTTLSGCPKPSFPEFAFIGRSNVGKSSLINYLTNNGNLSKTSKIPGKTKVINHFLINSNTYFVDLPGYGYAKSSKEDRQFWGDFVSEYITQRETLKTVFILIDSSIDPQKIDLEFVSWVFSNNINFALVFTKIDKQSQAVISKNMNNFIKTLKDGLATMYSPEDCQYLNTVQISMVSASKKSGADKILKNLFV